MKRTLKAAVVIGLLGLPLVGIASPASAAPAAPAVASCSEYAPTGISLSQSTIVPGSTVTVSGTAAPGDTVTISLLVPGGSPITLGTATAGSNGKFSATVTVPANLPEGTYTISVTSPYCPNPATATIIVRYPTGECTGAKTITQKRGDVVEWKLLNKQFDKSKPITVSIVPTSPGQPTVVVYTGPYPNPDKITFTIPSTMIDGTYKIVETGTDKSGQIVSSRCGTLIVSGGAGGTCTGGTTYYFEETRLSTWNQYTAIVPVSLPAGTYFISDALSRDGYAGRELVTQLSEIWEVEFLNAAGEVVATSGHTADLPDNVASTSWHGPLGTVVLPAGVVGARAHQRPDIFPDGTPNSSVPVSFTICHADTGNTGNTGSTGNTGNTGNTGSTGNTGNTCTTPVKYVLPANRLAVSLTSVSPTLSANIPAGTHTITEAVSQDGYAGRQGVTQTSEIWDLQFLSASGAVLATSAHTGDVPDRQRDASWVGPLGTVTLPAGVVGVRAHHRPDVFPDGTDNSVVATSFSLCLNPVGGTGTTGSTAAPTTAVPVQPKPTSGVQTVDTSGVLGAGLDRANGAVGSTSATTSGSRVAGTTTTRVGSTNLAITGSTVRPLIVLASLLVAIGSLVLLGRRRRTER